MEKNGSTDVNQIGKVKKLLQEMILGEPLFYEGLTVFPIKFEQQIMPEYILLEEALSSKNAIVTEKVEGGSVPELLLVNKSKNNILLLDGEELVGAKQNRIINISFMCLGMTEIVIPVSCVEQGRWAYKSRSFESGDFSSSRVRKSTKMSVMHSHRTTGTYRSDQGAVWNEVENLMSDIDAHSDTSAMHEGFEQRKSDLSNFENKIKIPDGFNGYMAFYGNILLSCDFFNDPSVLKKKWDKLRNSFVIESFRHRRAKPDKTTFEEALGFLKLALYAVKDTFKTPGAGTGIHLESERVVGHALVFEDCVVHISMFDRKY